MPLSTRKQHFQSLGLHRTSREGSNYPTRTSVAYPTNVVPLLMPVSKHPSHPVSSRRFDSGEFSTATSKLFQVQHRVSFRFRQFYHRNRNRSRITSSLPRSTHFPRRQCPNLRRTLASQPDVTLYFQCSGFPAKSSRPRCTGSVHGLGIETPTPPNGNSTSPQHFLHS